MIIRRKPIGFNNLRKPRSLGMSLLRDSIQRMHNHTVQRVSPSDEPLSAAGEFEDFEAGIEAEDFDQDDAYQASFEDAIRNAEASTPGVNKPVRRTPASAGKKPVQRQSQPTAQKPAAKNQSVQRAPADAAPASGVFKRQQLTEGDTMPRDLSSIMNMHRERAGSDIAPGDNPPPAVMEAPARPSFLADRAIKKAESPATVARKPAAPGSSVTPVQRQVSDAAPANFDPDEPPPRPRRRAQIVDITPPRKGLPFGLDSDADIPESGASSSPIGQPVQRDALPTQEAPTGNNDDFFAALERAASGSAYTDPEQVAQPESQADDASQTLLDLDVRSMRAASASETVQRTVDDDAAVFEDAPAAEHTDAYQSAMQAAIQRAEAPTPRDHEDSPDNPADFDPDDGGNNGGGSTPPPSTPPRNTPSKAKPGTVQPARSTKAPKNSVQGQNVVQPERTTDPVDNFSSVSGSNSPTQSDSIAPSAPRQTVQRTPAPRAAAENPYDNQSDINNQPIESPRTPTNTIQRDFDAASAQSEVPAGYNSAEDYQSAFNAAISAAEGPTQPAIQRDFDDSADYDNNPAEYSDTSADISAPRASSVPGRTTTPATLSIQRNFDDSADYDSDVEYSDDSADYANEISAADTSTDIPAPRASSVPGRTTTPATPSIQRDFDDQSEATSDYFPTGYDSSEDYQSAISAAINRAEAPTEPEPSGESFAADVPGVSGRTPAAKPPTVQPSRKNTPSTTPQSSAFVQRDFDANNDSVESYAEPADAVTTPRTTRTTRAAQAVQRDFDAGYEDTDYTESDESYSESVDTPTPRAGRTSQTVQRDFDADVASESDSYPSGYQSAADYQAAINAAIQRAEAPTPVDTPPTKASGKSTRTTGNSVQRSAKKSNKSSTVQRSPDASPSSPARSSRQGSEPGSVDRGVFLTGDVMNEPPSLEDDARAVWAGLPYAGAVQRDFDADYGGDFEMDDSEEFAGDDVQRTPDFASFGDDTESDDDSGAPSGIESELLQMIGMSPDTPISRSSSSVQRSPAFGESDSSDAPAELSGLVQRAVGSTRGIDAPRAVSETNTDESSDDKLSPEKSEQIEKVAQAVYSKLRDRLKVERERLRGRRS